MPRQCFFCRTRVPAFASLPCGHLGLCTECKADPDMESSIGEPCAVCRTEIESEIAIDGSAFGAPCKAPFKFKARSCKKQPGIANANAVAIPCGHLANCFDCAEFNHRLAKSCRVPGCNQGTTGVVQLFCGAC